MNCTSPAAKLFLHVVAVAVAILGARGAAAQDDPPIFGYAIVRFVPGTDVGAFNAQYQTTIFRSIASRNIYELELPPGDEQQLVDQMDADPRTVWAERNYFADAAEASGRSFYFNTQPGSPVYSQQFAWMQVGLSEAHQMSTGQGTVIAVVDTGVSATHEALAGRVLPSGYNFVDENGDTSDSGTGEMVGHGTHVAGIAAFMAPDALILPVKVLDPDGKTDNFLVAAGIFYALDQGADVINVCIGSTYRQEAVEDAVEEARVAGVVVVAPVGNLDTTVPEYPALFEDAIGTAAVDDADIKADFSNYNSLTKISAPGVEIYSAIPDDNADNLYAAWNGTSMCAPMVSGAAALVLALHPEWPADASRSSLVEAYVTQSAINIDPLNPQYQGQLGAGRLDASAALNAPIVFGSARSYATGSGPVAAACADFDRDGRPDLAVANSNANSVWILLNDGHGTFDGPPVIKTVGGGPASIAAGDLNSDRLPDLVVAGGDGASIAVLLNSGGGTFANAVAYAVGDEPTGVVLADLTGDGAADIAACNSDSNSATVLRNNGNGTFVLQGSYPAGDRPEGIVCADFDGDSDFDLVIVNRDSNSLSFLRNNGNGTFAATVSFATGLDPRSIAAGDFDHDGSVDLAVGIHDSRSVEIHANNGNGVFSIWSAYSLGAEHRPDGIIAADFSGDGFVDFAVTSSGGNTNFASLFVSDQGADFRGPYTFSVGAEPEGMAAGDVDCDGDLDLVTANSLAASLSVLRNETTPPRKSPRCGLIGGGGVNERSAVDVRRANRPPAPVRRSIRAKSP